MYFTGIFPLGCGALSQTLFDSHNPAPTTSWVKLMTRQFSAKTDSRAIARPRPWAAHKDLFAAICFIILHIQPAQAATPQTVVIGNDPGGAVETRARQIRSYRRSGTVVEIRGTYCLSSCTMYLGMKETCVAPDTVFGFHGPASRLYGIGLPPDQFDRWSRVMATHYPEPIKSWFLKTGRYRTVGFFNFSGEQIIRMGVRRCPPFTHITTG